MKKNKKTAPCGLTIGGCGKPGCVDGVRCDNNCRIYKNYEQRRNIKRMPKVR